MRDAFAPRAARHYQSGLIAAGHADAYNDATVYAPDAFLSRRDTRVTISGRHFFVASRNILELPRALKIYTGRRFIGRG